MAHKVGIISANWGALAHLPGLEHGKHIYTGIPFAADLGAGTALGLYR